jgi:hypothetical protein
MIAENVYEPSSTSVFVAPQIGARLTQPPIITGVLPRRSASRTAELQTLSVECRRYQHRHNFDTPWLSKHYKTPFSTTVFVAPQIVARLTEPSFITCVLPRGSTSRTAALRTLSAVCPRYQDRHNFDKPRLSKHHKAHFTSSEPCIVIHHLLQSALQPLVGFRPTQLPLSILSRKVLQSVVASGTSNPQLGEPGI